VSTVKLAEKFGDRQHVAAAGLTSSPETTISSLLVPSS
jgi:hypothetical protein